MFLLEHFSVSGVEELQRVVRNRAYLLGGWTENMERVKELCGCKVVWVQC